MTTLKTRSLIYLDHNATTPVNPRVLSRLPEALKAWGNPSSIHWAGREAKLLLREAHQILAKALGCGPLELIFTSGASESNNMVLKTHAAKALPRNELIISAVEHPSVFKTAMHLREQGVTVHVVPVSRGGFLDLDFYHQVLSEKTALVSIMFANNETGSIFPIKELAAKAHQVGALFHCDAVQALGKVKIDLQDLGVDYASFSAHKFYALKGTGLLYQKRGVPLVSLIHGGAQERQRRGGTENMIGIHALRVMAEDLACVSEKSAQMEVLKQKLESRILKEIPQVSITADQSLRLCNTSSFVLHGVDGETLLMSLDLKGFAVSTGAACSSGNPEPSPVLLAMGLTRAEAQHSLRVSLGWETTEADIDLFVEALISVVHRLRAIESQEMLHA